MIKRLCDVCETKLTIDNTVSGHWLSFDESAPSLTFTLGKVGMQIVQLDNCVDLDACVSCLFKAIPDADPRRNLPFDDEVPF